jgi:transmembrane sensor
MLHSHSTAEELLLIDSFLHYCKGTPEEDVLYWEQMLREHPELLPEVERARELYLTMQGYPPISLKTAALQRLKDSLDAQEVTPTVRRLSYKWIAAASVVAIALASFLVFNNKKEKSIHYTPLAETGLQDRTRLTLPDGSSVLLSTASRLQLSDNFNKGDRSVYLDGEAYFDVRSNASLPFTVITSKTATTVLGTAFKVRSYPTDQNAQIMLASGKVRVEAQSKTIELTPGEEAICEDGAGIKKANYQPENMQRWIQRKVEFVNADLDQISKTLEEYYGVKVKLEKRPTGKAVRFTGVFNNQQLNVVLDAISFTNEFSYRLEKNEVVIRF